MKRNVIVIVIYALLIFVFKSANAQTNKNPLSDKILVVVHMQQDSVTNELSKEANADVVKRINQLINNTKPENVVYAKITHKVLNLSLKKIYVDKINADLDSRLNLVNQNIFTDYNGDIFSSDELKEFIDKKNINEIVIVGRSAEGCIKTSVMKGLKLGHDIYILPNAIIGESDESKVKAINKLEKKGAKILII